MCGKYQDTNPTTNNKNDAPSSRIINAPQSLPRLYPWLMRIKRTSTYQTMQEIVFSVGTIINHNLILTCANCLCRRQKDKTGGESTQWKDNILCVSHGSQIGEIWNGTNNTGHGGSNAISVWHHDGSKYGEFGESKKENIQAVVHPDIALDIGYVKIIASSDLDIKFLDIRKYPKICLPRGSHFNKDVTAMIAGWGSRFEETKNAPNKTSCLSNEIGPHSFKPCISKNEEVQGLSRFCYSLPKQVNAISVDGNIAFEVPTDGNEMSLRPKDKECDRMYNMVIATLEKNGNSIIDFFRAVKRLKIYNQHSLRLHALCHVINKNKYNVDSICKTGSGSLEYGMCSPSCNFSNGADDTERYNYEWMPVKLFHEEPSKLLFLAY